MNLLEKGNVENTIHSLTSGEPDKIKLEKYFVRAEETKFSLRMKGTDRL